MQSLIIRGRSHRIPTCKLAVLRAHQVLSEYGGNCDMFHSNCGLMLESKTMPEIEIPPNENPSFYTAAMIDALFFVGMEPKIPPDLRYAAAIYEYELSILELTTEEALQCLKDNYLVRNLVNLAFQFPLDRTMKPIHDNTHFAYRHYTKEIRIRARARLKHYPKL